MQTKSCPGCYTVLHARAVQCPGCGFVDPRATQRWAARGRGMSPRTAALLLVLFVGVPAFFIGGGVYFALLPPEPQQAIAQSQSPSALCSVCEGRGTTFRYGHTGDGSRPDQYFAQERIICPFCNGTGRSTR